MYQTISNDRLLSSIICYAPTQLRGLLHTLELLATAISFPTLVIHVLQLIPPVQLIICLTIKRDMLDN